MKKLILLSLLIFGCLTNYAQDKTQYYEHAFYKVTFHKPQRGLETSSSRKKKDDDNNIVYTIITANDKEYKYKEKRALSEIPDSTYYLTEEPIKLDYHTWQKIKDGWLDLNPVEESEDWDVKFIEGKYKYYGNELYGEYAYGWDKVDGDYVIFHYGVIVSYEKFRCECSHTGLTLCPETDLVFNYSFELPFTTNVYVATKDNPEKKQDLKTLHRGETQFSVSTDDIIKKLGENNYNKPFDIYIISGSDSQEICQPGYEVGITHFEGIKKQNPYKNNKPHIKDDKLVIPGNPKDYSFILSGETISQSYDASEYNDVPVGKFELQISDKEKKHCQVNYDAYVPKVEYNHINSSKDYTHWYDEDYRSDAIQLKICYLDDGSVNDVSITGTYPNNSQHTFKSSPGTKIPIEKVQKYNEEHQRDGEVDLSATPYTIGCFSDLQSIKIEPKDIEHSIYTIISTQNQGEKTGKLKAYPKIEATLVSYQDPHCNYDDAVIKIKDISGGLGFGDQDKYIFEVEDDNNIVPYKDDEGEWSISVKNHDLETISLSIFDENVKNDSGRNKRAKSFSFTVNRPQPLYIPAPSISHPLCTFDSNGSIAINTAAVQLSHDVDPIYTWSVIKGDKDNQTTTSIGLGPTISNLPAGFYQVELNNDNCIDTGSYELIDPPLLEFESTTSSNAKCYGYSDGSIFTNVKGGTPGYKYSWNVGATSNNLLNIPKGKYKLTVLDAHKCQIQTDTIDISEPPQVINNNIAHDYSICQDSELEIDAGTFADYVWKNPQGIILTPEDYNILKLNNSSPEGEYYLKTIRYDDCFAEDFINITQNKESLKMNFLLPSDIYNDDYAKIVETSSHELDSLKWSFSENLIGDFPKDSTTLTISTNALDKLSTYKIKLTGYYKGCISTVTKNLNISNLTRPEEEYIPDFYDSDEILDCRIGPNPNNGNFTLFLDLDCAKDAVLTIYSISSYKYVLREKLVGLQNYEHSINQNLQQGLYILEVKTPKSIRRIKFEVTK